MTAKEIEHMPPTLRILAAQIQAPDCVPAMCLRDAASMIESLERERDAALDKLKRISDLELDSEDDPWATLEAIGAIAHNALLPYTGCA